MIGGAVRSLLVALLGTSGGLGCWKYCTDAGCSSGLEINVLSSGSTFAPGTAPAARLPRGECSDMHSALLRLVRNGVEIGEKQFSPSYETAQLNGSGCKPTCTAAKEVAQF